ncbi:hypothetical protein Q7P37_004100 [Cladosporium fusiforme]
MLLPPSRKRRQAGSQEHSPLWSSSQRASANISCKLHDCNPVAAILPRQVYQRELTRHLKHLRVETPRGLKLAQFPTEPQQPSTPSLSGLVFCLCSSSHYTTHHPTTPITVTPVLSFEYSLHYYCISCLPTSLSPAESRRPATARSLNPPTHPPVPPPSTLLSALSQRLSFHHLTLPACLPPAATSTKPQYRTSLLGAAGESYKPLHSNSFSVEDRRNVYNPGGYHDREGLPTSSGNVQKRGCWRSMMWLPNSRWTWSFALVALFQAIIALAIEGYVFGRFEVSLNEYSKGTSASHSVPTYLALFIFGFLYQLVLVYDALRAKNTIQVIGLCLYNAGMLVYSGVQLAQVKEAIDALIVPEGGGPPQIDVDIWDKIYYFLLACPCVIALGTILLSGVAWKLYREFAWTIYKNISADLRLKRRYLTFQIYIALLKFDFFFFLAFTVQFLVIVGSNFTDFEFYLTIVAVPVTVCFLLFAAFVTRRESYIGQAIMVVVYFAAMAYFIFKLVRMYDKGDMQKVGEYLPARKALTVFAVITIILLIATIVTACLCTRNFNKGLKPHIQKRKVENSDNVKNSTYGAYGAEDFQGPAHPLGQIPNRMTID